jgi:hypothetical protein
MQQFRIPMFFGTQQHAIDKIECIKCGTLSGCSPKTTIFGHSPPDLSKFKDIVYEAVGASISHWHHRRESLSVIDVKILMAMMCLFYNVDDKDCAIIKDINISEPFLRDLRRHDGDTGRIIFSLFRACAYESSTSPKGRHILSTDWHPNTPSRSGRFDLYRVDVLDVGRSGVKTSGVERVLIGKSNGKFTAIFYTNKHDFPKKTIDARIEEIS